MRNRYRPKRSRKQWLIDAPEYILAIYDNPKFADRYTVLIGGTLYDPQLAQIRHVEYLGLSDNPSHPQGFSQWGEMPCTARASYGKHISWLDLPEHVRQHVITRCTT